MYTIYQVTENGVPIYVGYTGQNPPEKRWTNHLQSARLSGSTQHIHLRMRAHKNSLFEWSVLEQGRDETIGRRDREAYWIEKINPICNHAKGGIGGNWGGSNNGRWKDGSAQRLAGKHLGSQRKGKKNSEQHVRNAAIAKSMQWEIISPIGEIIIIVNLCSFCRLHGLDQGAMVRVSSSQRQHHHGWKCKHVFNSVTKE